MVSRRQGSLWQRRTGAFVDAARGIRLLLEGEAHARFHLLATLAVVGLGVWTRISSNEWLAISLAIGLVWVAEGLNSAIEACVDLASPDHHQLAGKAKDIAAGAVLLAAICAAIVGILVFVPRLSKFLI